MLNQQTKSPKQNFEETILHIFAEYKFLPPLLKLDLPYFQNNA